VTAAAGAGVGEERSKSPRWDGAGPGVEAGGVAARGGTAILKRGGGCCSREPAPAAA